MSSSRPTQCSSSSSRTRQNSRARILAQTTLDAELNAEYEESGDSFDYSKLVEAQRSGPPEQQGRSEKVIAYLQHIQRGKLIQPFGCLLALDEKSFRVIAFSENAPEMLTTVSHAVPNVDDPPKLGIGTNVRSLFTDPGATALQKALGFADVSLLNPILVQCKTSGKPFYAIVHRATGCLVVDFEPVKPTEFPATAAGALQSYKLAAKAISKIQSLPGGSMEALCNTVVKEVFDLTGYDRVMAYKFHEDEHGEVFAEITKPGIEPYLGLHYPATDIPQAARFLFMNNKVRMICDCRARSVKILEDEALSIDISLCGSTLRAPHSCHLQYMENMNSIASLVMAVVVNENEEDDEPNPEQPQQQQKKRLWGLLVCHHESPRYVPFPLRYACEFLAQVFAVHVNKEFELEKQIREKSILRMQTMLSDMLFREASPLSIISGSPNIMDLVRCDGAALLYGDKVWRLQTAPTESQIRDIAFWLSEVHRDSTGLSTDSLQDAGYPGAASLGDMICGMAVAKITSKDILFWFRSHTAAEIKWGGAKHDPSDKDDNRRMHPRLSFKAFLEVVKMKSLPWNDYEMDAIHSLQLILRGTLNDATKPAQTSGLDNQIGDLKLDGLAELQAVTSEMVRLMETATVPILAVDGNGLVNGWNQKVAELTGLRVDEAIGRHILTLVEDSSVSTVQRMLYLALQGREEKEVRFELKTHGSKRDDGPVILVVNACASRDLHDHVVGVCFVAQDMTVHKLVMDKFTRVEGDYKAIVHNPNPLIPPIFGADQFGWCSEWNAAMTKLTGWHRDEVIDKMLLGEVFDSSNASCLLKNKDAFVRLCIIINSALAGDEAEKAPFGFFDRNGKHIECLLSVNRKVNADGVVTGVFCFIHVPSDELQHALHVQQASEQTAVRRLKAFSYMRHAIDTPLSDVVVAAVSQVLIGCQGKGIRVSCNLPERFMKQKVYGDDIRLQQILSDFLFVSVKFSPVGGSVDISSKLTKNSIGESLHLIDLELRIKHQGTGVPAEILSQMYEEDNKERNRKSFRIGVLFLPIRHQAMRRACTGCVGGVPYVQISDCREWGAAARRSVSSGLMMCMKCVQKFRCGIVLLSLNNYYSETTPVGADRRSELDASGSGLAGGLRPPAGSMPSRLARRISSPTFFAFRCADDGEAAAAVSGHDDVAAAAGHAGGLGVTTAAGQPPSPPPIYRC
ncbi:phytochrome A1 apoprotein [Panicum miliaceum]|uniref:Phytochrome A1 apoprotein n=1 Tax=Panicum miliaceum TaxID=4540 RepID=A0A3L6S6W8_PANMI|nr:phytochrome A1 apoprotein [Panicum miliaceum]